MPVYLLHLDRPYPNGRHPQHYIGYAEDVEARIEEHRKGNGARFMAAVAERGIGFQVVRVREDSDRNFERRLKNQKHAWRHCPVCRANRKGGN